jgi:hypothetical protein
MIRYPCTISHRSSIGGVEEQVHVLLRNQGEPKRVLLHRVSATCDPGRNTFSNTISFDYPAGTNLFMNGNPDVGAKAMLRWGETLLHCISFGQEDAGGSYLIPLISQQSLPNVRILEYTAY